MAGETEVLQELGLTPNEAKIYLILVKGGAAKATELAKKSGLQRRSVYDVLDQLEKKGLAGKSESAGVTIFSPSPPSSLLSLLDEKKDAVEKVLPGLSRSFEAEQKVGASVLYGKGGVKMVLEDILELKCDFCVYYGQMKIIDILPKFFPIFNEKRTRLGIKARWMLLDTPEVRKKAARVPNVQFKFIDPSTVSGGVWWVYADRLVLFVVGKEEVTTIIIKNAELAKTFQKTFDDVFGSSTQTYNGEEGIKAVLERTLLEKETLFIGGSGQGPKTMPDYFGKEYNPRALKGGHIWRNIAHRSIMKTPAASLPYHEMRFFPKSWPPNPNVIWIFGSCVANVVWLPQPVAFLVEDRHVADAYRRYFSLLWKIAEKR